MANNDYTQKLPQRCFGFYANQRYATIATLLYKSPVFALDTALAMGS
jgi:hypothetical protein